MKKIRRHALQPTSGNHIVKQVARIGDMLDIPSWCPSIFVNIQNGRNDHKVSPVDKFSFFLRILTCHLLQWHQKISLFILKWLIKACVLVRYEKLQIYCGSIENNLFVITNKGRLCTSNPPTPNKKKKKPTQVGATSWN